MKLLTTTTEQAARDYERRAWAFCCTVQGNKGGQWSDILTNHSGKWAIVWEDALAAVFSTEERAGVVDAAEGEWEAVAPEAVPEVIE